MPVYEKPSRAKRPRQTEKRWQVVVEHGGQRVERIFYGTKREAEDFEAAERLKLAAKRPGALRGVPKFSGFCVEHYKPHAELRLKKGTWYRTKFIVAELAGYFGDMSLDQIGVSQVDGYQRARLASGVKHVTVNNECRILRRILNYAGELGVPVTGKVVKLLKESERRVTVWSEVQVKALLAACAEVSPEIVPLVVTLLNAGLRKGEAIALTWKDVDLTKGQITISPSEEWQPKSNRPREVPISKATLKVLKAQMGKSEKFVFPSADGEGFKFWPRRQFDRARKKAGLTGGPHICRHTFASHFLKVQPDLFLLAQVMGHSEVAVTRLYTHLLPDHLERARNAVDFPSPASPKRLKKRADEIRSQTARQAGRASGRSRAAAAPRAEKAA